MPLSDSHIFASSLVFAGAFVATVILIRQLKEKKKRQNYPPSIGMMPILGSIPYLPDMTEFHRFFLEKSYILGDIISFSVAGKYTVVLNSQASIHEALVKQASVFSDRPSFYFNHYMNPNYKGISDVPYTAEFKKNHQLSLAILKRFGFGQNRMEERIAMEVEDLMESLRKFNGAPTDPKDLVKSSVLNVIGGILFGERYGHGSTETTALIKSIHSLVDDAVALVVLDFFPALRFFPPYRGFIRNIVEATEKISRMTGEKIDRVEEGRKDKAGLEKDRDYDSFIEGFIDREGPGYDKEQLIYTVRDLVLAGTETSSTTIIWAMVTLANEQEIQARLHTEISGAVSHHGRVALSDKSRLPYTEAFTLELMRRRTLAVMAAPHSTSADTTVCGYFIPKDTMILPNLYAVHMNANAWDRPEEFKAERFLDETRTTVINKDQTMPFSVGRRACMGELLARQEIFMFLTALILNFHILPPDGQDKVDVKEVVLAALSPSPYEICFVPREGTAKLQSN